MLVLYFYFIGPHFIKTWDIYRKNTIIGCSALGGYIFLAFFTCLIYYFRWKPKTTNFYESNAVNGEINQAYQIDLPVTKLGPSQEDFKFDTTQM